MILRGKRNDSIKIGIEYKVLFNVHHKLTIHFVHLRLMLNTKNVFADAKIASINHRYVTT